MFIPFRRMPYNHHTIFEYFLYIPLHALFAFAYSFITVAVLTFFVNGCLLIEAGRFHVETIFREADELVKQPSLQRINKIKLILIDVIKIHRNMFG